MKSVHAWYRIGEGGYIVLASILVVGAIGTAITVASILFGVSASRTSLVVQQSAQARSLADMCAEEALQQIRDTASFTGSGGLSDTMGTCTYGVTSQGGANRTINASGTVGTNIRKVKVIINKINPLIKVVSWQEVADF